MKYKDLLANAFAQKSNQNTNVVIGVIAGLAVGAAIAVLFSPVSGRELRKGIAEKAEEIGEDSLSFYAVLKDRLSGNDPVAENAEDNEPQPLAQVKQKKAKSDIKELIHQSHVVNDLN